jgi:RHS repeat-associated protein
MKIDSEEAEWTKIPVDWTTFEVDWTASADAEFELAGTRSPNKTTKGLHSLPFGMQMPGRNGGEDYRYAFNGMEQDPEVSGDGNSYTTEFRHYDSRLGRWKSLDPLMAQFSHISAYAAYANNPIVFIDPYGLEPVTDEQLGTINQGNLGGNGDSNKHRNEAAKGAKNELPKKSGSKVGAEPIGGMMPLNSEFGYDYFGPPGSRMSSATSAHYIDGIFDVEEPNQLKLLNGGYFIDKVHEVVQVTEFTYGMEDNNPVYNLNVKVTTTTAYIGPFDNTLMYYATVTFESNAVYDIDRDAGDLDKFQLGDLQNVTYSGAPVQSTNSRQNPKLAMSPRMKAKVTSALQNNLKAKGAKAFKKAYALTQSIQKGIDDNSKPKTIDRSGQKPRTVH